MEPYYSPVCVSLQYYESVKQSTNVRQSVQRSTFCFHCAYVTYTYMYYNITNTPLMIYEKFFSNVPIFLDIQIVRTVYTANLW